MAEPLYVSSTEYHATVDGSSMVLSTPSPESGTDGVGDFLLFIAGTGTSNGAWQIPSGFTALTAGGENGSFNTRAFWRIATGSESASYTSALGYTYRRTGVFARYRRNATSSPIRDSGAVSLDGNASGTQSTSPTPTALTGTLSDDLVICIYLASETSSTGTQSLTTSGLSSAGWSVRQSVINETTSDEACGIILADKVGATDRPTASTNKDSNWVVYSLSLKGLSTGSFFPFFM